MIPVLHTRVMLKGVFFVLALSIWSGLSGCAPSFQPQPQELESARPDPATDVMFWDEGLRKFRVGDFDGALIDFDTLKSAAQNERYARMAAYASACTRLILAQTSEEFNEAMKLWVSWSDGEVLADTEDPRLLWPLLQRIALSGNPIMSDADCAKQAKSKKRPPYKVELVNKDLATYKSMVQAKEKESERLKTRLEAKEREIRRLKQQIESLEAIHLKFQERQKEISSP